MDLGLQDKACVVLLTGTGGPVLQPSDHGVDVRAFLAHWRPAMIAVPVQFSATSTASGLALLTDAAKSLQ